MTSNYKKTEPDGHKPISLEDVNAIVHPDYFQPRQWDVLRLKLLGYTGREICKKLGISEYSVHARFLEIRQILHLSDGSRRRKQSELMQWAQANGLIEARFEVPPHEE